MVAVSDFQPGAVGKLYNFNPYSANRFEISSAAPFQFGPIPASALQPNAVAKLPKEKWS